MQTNSTNSLRVHGSENLADSLDAYQLQLQAGPRVGAQPRAQPGAQPGARSQQWSDVLLGEVLKVGKVDFFEKVTARPEKLELIRRALRSVRSEQPHPLRVVLVHGMGGSGKSVLASEAVRCAPLMAECYPDGVIWKSAEHTRGLEEAALARAIHELLRDILSSPQLNWGPREGQRLQETTDDQLGAEIINTVANKQLLLVLDGVWQQDVLAALKDVPILVLATSRNSAIAKHLPAHTEYVEAMKCTEHEARSILTSHCGPVDEEATKVLLKRCDGLPLALAIVAALMKDKSSEKQREVVNTPSNAEWLVGEIPAALTSRYECLYDALRASICELEKEIKERRSGEKIQMLSGVDISNLYRDIAALDDGEDLVASRLDSVWNQSTELTGKLLQVLADRSLLTRTGKKRGEEDVFTIHDVQLHFLRELVRRLEGGSLNNRYRRWIGGFLLKDNLSDLLVSWEHTKELLYFEELCRIVRAFEKGSDWNTAWWQRCMKPIGNLFEQRDKLPAFQRGLFTMLLSKVCPSQRGWTIVHQASLEGNTNVVMLLIQNGADVNPKDMFGKTPLHHASENGKAKTAEVLIKAGANVNEKNRLGETPLHTASDCGSTETAEVLIEAGANVNAKTDKGILYPAGSIPLHMASYNGKTDVVTLLIQKGADVNHKNAVGQTPLHQASLNGQAEAAEVLIEAGADVNAKTDMELDIFPASFTPLHLVSLMGSAETAEVLLKAGANVNAKTDTETDLFSAGSTPLHFASLMGPTEVVKVLLRNKADKNLKDSNGQSPMDVIETCTNADVIKALFNE